VTIPAILLPVFVEVALIFALLFLMAGRRFAAVRAGGVRREDVILGQRAWPDHAQSAANAYSNQFELPVLFFAIVPLAIITRKADLLFVILSWIFVLSRIVHAAAYVTRNVFPLRFGSFVAGAAALMIMWVVFAVRILAGPWPA
jgi:hypothetical protein